MELHNLIWEGRREIARWDQLGSRSQLLKDRCICCRCLGLAMSWSLQLSSEMLSVRPWQRHLLLARLFYLALWDVSKARGGSHRSIECVSGSTCLSDLFLICETLVSNVYSAWSTLLLGNVPRCARETTESLLDARRSKRRNMSSTARLSLRHWKRRWMSRTSRRKQNYRREYASTTKSEISRKQQTMTLLWWKLLKGEALPRKYIRAHFWDQCQARQQH